VPDDFADSGVKRRFADAGKCEVIDFRMLRELRVDFGDYGFRRIVFLPDRRQVRGRAAFAVNAVEGAGFEGEQINSEGQSEPAGRDRPEDCFCFDDGAVLHNSAPHGLTRGIIYAFFADFTSKMTVKTGNPHYIT